MKISKEFTLEASHILPNHPGKCSKLHGHSWTVRISITGTVNTDPMAPDLGFVKDYAELTAWMKPTIERFDHSHLNCFIKYPSAENIATHIAWLLNPLLQHSALMVEVSETRKTWAVWSSEDDKDVLRLIGRDASDDGWKSPQFNAPIFKSEQEDLISACKYVVEGYRGQATAAVNIAMDKLKDYEQLKMYVDSLKPVDLKAELKAAETA